MTLILDTRGREETPDQLVESLKPEFASIGGTITNVTLHGQRDFARVTDVRRPNGVYVTCDVEAASGFATALRGQLRLNKLVYRTLIERAT